MPPFKRVAVLGRAALLHTGVFAVLVAVAAGASFFLPSDIPAKLLFWFVPIIFLLYLGIFYIVKFLREARANGTDNQ